MARRRFVLSPQRVLLLIAVAFALALCVVFPGQRLPMALRIATGIWLEPLQSRIDALEAQAIARRPFNDDDREFLIDFYRTLASGAKLSLMVAQTGKLMDHYLDGSGSDFELEPSIVVENSRVKAEMAALRSRVRKGGCNGKRLSSPRFYMPDPSQIDSVFGLYHGDLQVTAHATAGGRCQLDWRAEVPWVWPSYESLKRQYGDHHAESFPLPNLKALLDRRHALRVDNGLGQYLVELGLARSFLAYAEWSEVTP